MQRPLWCEEESSGAVTWFQGLFSKPRVAVCAMHLASAEGIPYEHGRDASAPCGALGEPESVTTADGSVMLRRRSVSMKQRSVVRKVEASALAAVGQGKLRIKFAEPRRRKQKGASCSVELKGERDRDVVSLEGKSRSGVSGRVRLKGRSHLLSSASLPSGRGSVEMEATRKEAVSLKLASPVGSLRVDSNWPTGEAGERTVICTPTLRFAVPFEWSVPFRADVKRWGIGKEKDENEENDDGDGDDEDQDGGNGNGNGNGNGTKSRTTIETTLSRDGAHIISLSAPMRSVPTTLSATLAGRNAAPGARFPTLELRSSAFDGACAGELAYSGGLRARAGAALILPLPLPLPAAAAAAANGDTLQVLKLNAELTRGGGGGGGGDNDDAEVDANISATATTAWGAATAHTTLGGATGLALEAPLGAGFVSLDVLASPGARAPACSVRAGIYR